MPSANVFRTLATSISPEVSATTLLGSGDLSSSLNCVNPFHSEKRRHTRSDNHLAVAVLAPLSRELLRVVGVGCECIELKQ